MRAAAPGRRAPPIGGPTYPSLRHRADPEEAPLRRRGAGALAPPPPPPRAAAGGGWLPRGSLAGAAEVSEAFAFARRAEEREDLPEQLGFNRAKPERVQRLEAIRRNRGRRENGLVPLPPGEGPLTPAKPHYLAEGAARREAQSHASSAATTATSWLDGPFRAPSGGGARVQLPRLQGGEAAGGANFHIKAPERPSARGVAGLAPAPPLSARGPVRAALRPPPAALLEAAAAGPLIAEVSPGACTFRSEAPAWADCVEELQCDPAPRPPAAPPPPASQRPFSRGELMRRQQQRRDRREADAATAVQSAYRGHAARSDRRRLEEQRRAAAESIQRSWHRHSLRAELSARQRQRWEEHDAASRIQAVHRGRRSRQQQRRAAEGAAAGRPPQAPAPEGAGCGEAPAAARAWEPICADEDDDECTGAARGLAETFLAGCVGGPAAADGAAIGVEVRGMVDAVFLGARAPAEQSPQATSCVEAFSDAEALPSPTAAAARPGAEEGAGRATAGGWMDESGEADLACAVVGFALLDAEDGESCACVSVDASDG